MAIITRKKTLQVGKPKAPVQEIKIGKMVQITSVKSEDGSKIQWRQRDNLICLREPFHGTLNIVFHPLEPVDIATYYPFPPTK